MSAAADSAREFLAGCQDVHARAALAAHECWGIRNRSVILLDSDSAVGVELRSVLTGMGLAVFHGPYATGIIGRPLLMFAVDNRLRSDVTTRLEITRRVHPTSPVCVVTGLLPVCPSSGSPYADLYDDGRAMLQAAGIGFLSEVEYCNVPAA